MNDQIHATLRIGVPGDINGYPVIAAVLNESRNPTTVDGYVMCRQLRGPQDEGGYCTWHVWWQIDYPDEGWLAENGHYDMTYTDALADFAQRAGMTVIGE